MEAFITALTTGFTEMTTNAMSGIGSIAPTALPIMGALLLLALGRKAYKALSK